MTDPRKVTHPDPRKVTHPEPRKVTHTGDPGCTRAETREFYRRAFAVLDAAGIPFLVGGAFALAHYTGVRRYTKDVDVFVRPADVDRLLATLAAAGCAVERTFAHWLAKARCGEDFIDVIFSSGNALCAVDDAWFAHAEEGTAFDLPVRLCPPEEMIWSKAFIMERERYDGADVAHVLRARLGSLDWRRLLARFEAHWEVLLSHLVLFGFVYPDERERLPRDLMQELARRLTTPAAPGAGRQHLTRGTLLSRSQYEIDVREWGYRDARLLPVGCMTARDAERFTAAAAEEDPAR